MSTFAKDDEAEVLTFQIHDQNHRLSYRWLNFIMGVDRTNDTTIRYHEYIIFLRSLNVYFQSQITGLYMFSLSRQKEKHIVHPCWQIKHQILSTSIFSRLEPGQINRCDLFFLDCISWIGHPNFSTFFLNYFPADYHQPKFLLDSYALKRLEMLDSRGSDLYNWLDGDNHAVYIIHSWIGDSFLLKDPSTWLPPDQLTLAGVLPYFEDGE